MKNLVLVLILLAFLVMSACASGPRIRDTSHDDPRKIGEIERLVSHKASSAVLGGESKFSPRENVGWTIYRMYDKETKTTSALEVQIVPAGPGKHWLETRIVTPSNRSVTRLLVGTTGKPVGKTADGKPITKRLFRMITWNDAEKAAREYPPDFIASSNSFSFFPFFSFRIIIVTINNRMICKIRLCKS